MKSSASQARPISSAPGHLIDITPQESAREICIDHGCVTAPHELGQARLTWWLAVIWVKPIFSAILGHLFFVIGVQIGMQPGDRHGANALVIGRLKRGARGGFIQRSHHRALGIQTLVQFRHVLIQQIGPLDFQIKKPRPVW